MRAVHISGDTIGAPGGAGKVTHHELLALIELYGKDEVATIQLSDIRPADYQGYDIPFLWDYFALSQLHDSKFDNLEHAHIYSGSFAETVLYLQSRGVKTTMTSPAHDKDVSRTERHLRSAAQPNYIPHIDNPLLWEQFKKGLLGTDLVIATSIGAANFLAKEGVNRLTVIPHGIESIPSEIAGYPQEFTVGYLGGYGPDKGLFYLMDAWGKLGWPHAQLIMAGYDSWLMEDCIRAIAGAGRFQLAGWIDDVADFYNACTVYCQPSVTEGFGIEVLEAMSFGRPVICCDGAGAIDLITPSSGWMAESANTESLQSTIALAQTLFAAEGDWIETMGRAAQKQSHDYTWDKIRKRYIDTWRQINPNA